MPIANDTQLNLTCVMELIAKGFYYIFMKILIIFAAVASLAFPATSASAQNTTGAAISGMGSADSALRAKGDVKGAERIERAECFSGKGPCSEKDAAKVKKSTGQETAPSAKSAKPD